MKVILFYHLHIIIKIIKNNMSCLLTSGYSVPCRVTSGIQAVYITSHNYGIYNGSGPFVLDNTGSSPLGTGSVTGITGSTPTFYKFNQRLEQGSYMESGIYGENGSAGFSQKLEITLEGYDQPTKNTIAILNKGSWSVIVLDQNGNYILMGYQNPVLITTADGGLGKTLVDGVKTTLTFEGKESNQAPSVNSSVITLLGLV
jgi:hypothetical protein